MRYALLVEDHVPYITPLKIGFDVIFKLKKTLKTSRDRRQFCGMVNYQGIFLKDLKKLISIYNWTRKGMPFHWREEYQKVLDEIKQDLTNLPVLVMLLKILP